MVGKGDGAVGALGHVVAGGAVEERGVSSSVEEQDGLFVSADAVADGAFERFGDDASEGGLCQRRWLRSGQTLWECLSACCVAA